MSKTDQIQCDKYLESFAISESEINTARYEGKLEGREEGRGKERKESICNAYRKV